MRPALTYTPGVGFHFQSTMSGSVFMKEVVFVDGRKTTVDADSCFTPEGEVILTKRIDDTNVEVRRYQTSQVRNVNDIEVLPVKVIAIKLLTACSKTEPHGSRKLCQIAGIEYSDLIVPILKKLREAGKVIFASGSGKWTRS
jgi:hypothetical protein